MEEQPDASIECAGGHIVEDAAEKLKECTTVVGTISDSSSVMSELANVNDSPCNQLGAGIAGGVNVSETDSENQTSDTSAEHHLSEMMAATEPMNDGPDVAAEHEHLGKGHEDLNEDMEVGVSHRMETLKFAGSPEPLEANGDPAGSPVTGGAMLPQAPLLLNEVREKQSGSEESEESSSSEDSSSDSDSDSSSSSSSSSLGILDQPDDDEVFAGVTNGKRPPPIKSQDEILIEDLPAVEDLNLILPEDAEIQPIGVISSIIEQLVIIESLKDMPPLNDDSFIFDGERRAVGKVFEIFGPVTRPYYVLRFNSVKHISEKGLKINDTMHFAPSMKDFTDYIFTEQLKVLKGSDASWKNDQEPPPEALDFSDDEEEKQAKQKRKKTTNAQKKPPQTNQNESDDILGQASRPRAAGGGRGSRALNPPVERGFPNWHFPHHNPVPAARGGMLAPPPGPHQQTSVHLPYPPPFQHPPPYYLPFPPPPPMSMPWPGLVTGPPPPLHGLPFQHLPPPPPPPPPPST